MRRYYKQILCLLLIIFAFIPFAIAGCGPNTPALQSFTIDTNANYGERGAVYGGGKFYSGQTTTLYASANEGWIFTRWSDNVTDNPRQVVANKDTSLYAVFTAHSTTRVIQATSSSSTYGTVYGGGSYKSGETVYLYAVPSDGCKFVRWNDNNKKNPRAVIADENKSFVATFTDNSSIGLSKAYIESAQVTVSSARSEWVNETITCKDFLLTVNGNTTYTVPYGGGVIFKREYNSNNYYLNAVRNTFRTFNNVGIVNNELDVRTDVKDSIQCKVKLAWGDHEDDEWVTLSLYNDSIIFGDDGKMDVYFDYLSYGMIKITFIYFGI